MPKILSQAGTSLADIYEVAGSIAGIETLETESLPIVHEMGATVFSERFGAEILGINSGSIAQSLPWANALADLPPFVSKIMSVQVRVSVTARVAHCSVAIQDVATQREIPIWSWDSTTDIETNITFSDDGAAAATTVFLQPAISNRQLPHIMAGEGQPEPVAGVVFRGLTTAFGAGTLDADVLLHVAFAELGGLSSRGLPIPSW